MCDTQNVLNIQLSHDKYILLAAVGEYLPYVGENVLNQLDKKLLEEIQAVLKSKTSQRINDQYIHYYETSNGNVNLLCLSCSKELNDASKKLIDFFPLLLLWYLNKKINSYLHLWNLYLLILAHF